MYLLRLGYLDIGQWGLGRDPRMLLSECQGVAVNGATKKSLFFSSLKSFSYQDRFLRLTKHIKISKVARE